MITYNYSNVNLNQTKFLNQTKYTQSIEHLNFAFVACPSCKLTGHLIKHGGYQRKFTQETGTITLVIQRVRCKNCKHTHAILPVNIVPYLRYSVSLIVLIVKCFTAHKGVADMVRKYDLDMDTVKSVNKSFRDGWLNRLTSLELDIESPVEKIIHSSFRHFNLQFMQKRRCHNFLFPLTT